MYTDPIADMLTRIRNAQMVNKSEVVLPYSKLKFNIAKILEENKWIEKVEVIEPEIAKEVRVKNRKEIEAKFKRLKIDLVYEDNSQPKIKHLQRVSRPGRRVYVSRDEIPTVLNGFGMAVISTSKGLMSDKQARQAKVGGEIICQMY